MKNIVKTVCGVAGGVAAWFLGGFDGFLYALVAFMALDYVTGTAVAASEKKLSSSAGFRGILRKTLMLAMVGAGNLLDSYILSDGAVIRTVVIFFYIANEGISVAENAAKLGLPVTEKLKNALAQIK